MAPANWMPCDPMIEQIPKTLNLVEKKMEELKQKENGMSWYLTFKNPEKCKEEIKNNLIDSKTDKKQKTIQWKNFK